jgi:hypothetical protein
MADRGKGEGHGHAGRLKSKSPLPPFSKGEFCLMGLALVELLGHFWPLAARCRDLVKAAGRETRPTGSLHTASLYRVDVERDFHEVALIAAGRPLRRRQEAGPRLRPRNTALLWIRAV